GCQFQKQHSQEHSAKHQEIMSFTFEQFSQSKEFLFPVMSCQQFCQPQASCQSGDHPPAHSPDHISHPAQEDSESGAHPAFLRSSPGQEQVSRSCCNGCYPGKVDLDIERILKHDRKSQPQQSSLYPTAFFFQRPKSCCKREKDRQFPNNSHPGNSRIAIV